MPSSLRENSVTVERLLLSVLSNWITMPPSLPTGVCTHRHTHNPCYILACSHTLKLTQTYSTKVIDILTRSHTQADSQIDRMNLLRKGKSDSETGHLCKTRGEFEAYRGGRCILLQSLAGRGGGSLGKWILFSDASTRVRGLTAHYSGPGPLCSPSDGWQGLLGGGEVWVSRG